MRFYMIGPTSLSSGKPELSSRLEHILTNRYSTRHLHPPFVVFCLSVCFSSEFSLLSVSFHSRQNVINIAAARLIAEMGATIRFAFPLLGFNAAVPFPVIIYNALS